MSGISAALVDLRTGRRPSVGDVFSRGDAWQQTLVRHGARRPQETVRRAAGLRRCAGARQVRQADEAIPTLPFKADALELIFNQLRRRALRRRHRIGSMIPYDDGSPTAGRARRPAQRQLAPSAQCSLRRSRSGAAAGAVRLARRLDRGHRTGMVADHVPAVARRTKVLVAISWPLARISRQTTMARPARPTTHSSMQRTRGDSGWPRMPCQLRRMSARSCRGGLAGMQADHGAGRRPDLLHGVVVAVVEGAIEGAVGRQHGVPFVIVELRQRGAAGGGAGAAFVPRNSSVARSMISRHRGSIQPPRRPMSIPKLEFPPFHLPPEAEALRDEVRAFLKETLPKVKSEDRFASWNTFSPSSAELGKKGWIGITWPKKYGGSEKSFLERYVVTEELLGNSAPAGAHWVADRQSGSAAAALRQRGAARGDPAEDHRRRMLLLDRHERARFGLRPRLGAHARRAGAGRLPRQRHQGLDLGRASQPLLHRAGAHLGPARRPPQGPEPDPGRPQDAERHHPADHQSRRPARLERGHVQRRLHPRELPDRQRGRRLAAGDQRARLRALRPRALHAELLRPARAGARAGPPAGQARRRRSWAASSRGCGPCGRCRSRSPA